MTRCLCWPKSPTLWALACLASRCTPSAQQQVCPTGRDQSAGTASLAGRQQQATLQIDWFSSVSPALGQYHSNSSCAGLFKYSGQHSRPVAGKHCTRTHVCNATNRPCCTGMSPASAAVQEIYIQQFLFGHTCGPTRSQVLCCMLCSAIQHPCSQQSSAATACFCITPAHGAVFVSCRPLAAESDPDASVPGHQAVLQVGTHVPYSTPQYVTDSTVQYNSVDAADTR